MDYNNYLIKKNNKYSQKSLLNKVNILKEEKLESVNMIDILLDAIKQPGFKYLNLIRDETEKDYGIEKKNIIKDDDDLHPADQIIKSIKEFNDEFKEVYMELKKNKQFEISYTKNIKKIRNYSKTKIERPIVIFKEIVGRYYENGFKMTEDFFNSDVFIDSPLLLMNPHHLERYFRIKTLVRGLNSLNGDKFLYFLLMLKKGLEKTLRELKGIMVQKGKQVSQENIFMGIYKEELKKKEREKGQQIEREIKHMEKLYDEYANKLDSDDEDIKINNKINLKHSPLKQKKESRNSSKEDENSKDKKADFVKSYRRLRNIKRIMKGNHNSSSIEEFKRNVNRSNLPSLNLTTYKKFSIPRSNSFNMQNSTALSFNKKTGVKTKTDFKCFKSKKEATKSTRPTKMISEEESQIEKVDKIIEKESNKKIEEEEDNQNYMNIDNENKEEVYKKLINVKLNDKEKFDKIFHLYFKDQNYVFDESKTQLHLFNMYGQLKKRIKNYNPSIRISKLFSGNLPKSTVERIGRSSSLNGNLNGLCDGYCRGYIKNKYIENFQC